MRRALHGAFEMTSFCFLSDKGQKTNERKIDHMTYPRFYEQAMLPENPDYERATARLVPLYDREGDVRSPFVRDYTRTLHCLAYRRLKHKTQVFYNVGNDHICTRMEHVSHVESVSETIATSLGLSRELTRAISLAHDLGHAPFGHKGERIINDLSKEHVGESFWHERHGLRIVDHFEMLEDDHGTYRPLDLTFAVRDGIISHCGEVDENGIFPRSEQISLDDFVRPGLYQPSTWEGCVVKISDKIAYLGRDIEDALRLGFLSRDDKEKLSKIIKGDIANTTVLINDFVYDICKNSSPERGICLSDEMLAMMNEIKRFNYEYIYKSPELDTFDHYSELVISSLFKKLRDAYDPECPEKTLANLRANRRRGGELCRSFADWLDRFCLFSPHPEYASAPMFSRLESAQIYYRAIIDYISGMTDSYAIKAFDELISF